MNRVSGTIAAACLLALAVGVQAQAETRWAAYYADRAPLAQLDSYQLLVFDSDAHPPLRPLAQKGKTLLGYISLGEVENHRSYYAAVRNEGILLQENQNWKGSFFVDVRDPRWSKRVLDELVPQILGRGFAGIFLDTLDNPPHLEQTDPKKYKGMSEAAANLVGAIRTRYPAIKIMMNRGYDLLPRVEQHIDYVLGESVFADYDFETKTYRLVPASLYRQQVDILKAAQRRRAALEIFTLDYWNPADRQGIARIYAEQRRNGFSPYVATVDLDRIVPEPRVVAAGPPVPRTILVLYDGEYDKETRFLPAHQLAEMPLNHLGLVVRYHDINTALPNPREMTDVRGILTWFRNDSMADPLRFLSWAESAIDAGKKFVVMGDISATRDRNRNPTPEEALDRFWAKLGLQGDNTWTTITYDWSIGYKNSQMVEFERKFGGILPPFPALNKIDPRLRSYLTLRRGDDPETDTHLITIGPNGGHVAAGYIHFSTTEDAHRRQWFVNPFEFFREVFTTDELPKPDTTTISGRRIFYSHLDGDGWRNVSEIARYKKERVIAADVIYREVLRAFPDLPMTVAPIAGDIDPEWHGTDQSLAVAKSMLALPNVEAGSHTYGHPLDWQYFAGHHPAAEPAPPVTFYERVMRWLGLESTSQVQADAPPENARPPADAVVTGRKRNRRYAEPRTYDDKPYSLDLEIRDSIEWINTILPAGKQVRLLQWSGDTTPAEAAIAATRQAGVRNMNGGDTRFDPEFASYGWVAPLGRQVGNQRQVYASNSNENTYTDLWTDRFFGFKYLVETLKNTESPMRVKPHNIYFHMYSGEKLPSLLAVLDNYRYAQSQELAPITASTYASIVDGFHSLRLIPLEPNRWRIENRDGLQTVRFDRASDLSVDFSRSSGILGQRLYQNCLYVTLDSMDPAPVLALGRTPATGPYLSHSRWLISDLRINDRSFLFTAHGFGSGEAVWKVAPGRSFIIEVTMKDGTYWQQRRTSDENGMLELDLGPATQYPVSVRVWES
jgi:uncharacterized protein (TIGR01370 family)